MLVVYAYIHFLVFFLFPKVPEEIMANVSDQIPQVRPVPKKLEEYTEEEVRDFPKLWDYPEEYVIK